MRVVVLVFAACAGVLLAGSPFVVHAADVPVAGQKLVLKAATGKPASLGWNVKGTSVAAPPLGSGDDPRTTGATLTIVSARGERATFALPAGSWSQRGAKPVYRFKNPTAPNGPSPVKTALLRDG